ncbi:mrna guanine-7- methyltransferase [Holotrichia oblita]|uniref:Mrna guanine-7- methyltransferase n=1 Tax=Holotrichia oblita TaxID=644536 RepID=A0ACB9TD65_HOLOL|nr:mrna guanine-7- methyltransferase [Holotrichia oblita]
MATLDDESGYKAGSYDDLEQTLVQVAAAADARNNDQTEENEDDTANDESNEIRVEISNKSNDEEFKYKRKANYYSDLTAEEGGSTDRSEAGHHTNLKKRQREDDDDDDNKVKHFKPEEKGNKQESVERGKKRKHDETENVEVENIAGHAKVVATHYNALEEKGLDERSKSRIFHLRNFHNWIKSILINEYLTKIKDNKKHNEPIRVHDMCCGKGGDLLKWRKGNITHLICSDIASVSLEQCKARYQDMKQRSYRERHGNLYTTEYIIADCTRVRLREKYQDPSIELDLVSCQFAFHYSFESLPQAECMIKNAAECLRPGGYFIGTITDANELIARARNSDTNSFGNNVYNVIFDCNIMKPDLFGAKYHFYLDGSVDCPEFLVYFPLFEKLARKYGLKLVKKEKFRDFYERMKGDGKNLLTTTKSLETYPPQHGLQLVGNAEDDYEHAKLCLEKEGRHVRLGTLSKSEWEATSLYTTFVFEKVKGTLNEQGVTVYDI